MSTAVAAKATKVPPSTFATLLRRSKFASYDPKIGQIYATYDGSAARGDWGLKRPLAARRRDSRLAITSIDTLYQQTEWDSAYSDTIWVRKFEELGVMPTLDPAGSWAPRLGLWQKNVFSEQRSQWMHDSDYTSTNPEKVKKDLEITAPTPDPRAMGPKRLERFLRKVRRIQPEFQEFLAAEEESQSLGTNKSVPFKSNQMTLHQKAKHDYRDDKRFLADKFAQAYNAENSTVIRPMPHPNAALTYTYTSELQTALDSNPIPGRALHKIEDTTKHTTSTINVNIAVGGWTANEKISRKAPLRTVDWGMEEGGEPRTDVNIGKGLYRPTEVCLRTPPDVVRSKPQRIDETSLQMEVVNWAGVDQVRKNPHRPGTREYVAHLLSRFSPITPLRYQPPSKRYSKFTVTTRNYLEVPRNPNDTSQALHLLNRLKGLVPPPKDDKNLSDSE